MPELPEVEVARRAIEEHCVGKKITECSVAEDPKVIDGVSRADFESALVGRSIVAALRKGKNLWLRLDSPPFPTFQFGMAGAVYIKGVALTKYRRAAVNDTDEWPSKYSKVFVKLDDGLEFSFTDKRRFARVRLLDDPESVPPISELGPDALLELMPVDDFVDSLSKKKITIKSLLLDQSYISGIGNWIADEVLYQAKIHPLQIVSSLSKESCKSLHRCIREVIDKALEVGADSSQFPKEWIFHSREKKSGKAFVNDFSIRAGVAEVNWKPVKRGSKKKSRKARSDVEESESEEEDDNRTSKRSKTTVGVVGRQKKKTSEFKSDGIPSKGTMQKQVEAAKGTSKKLSESTRATTRQKKTKI